MTPTLTLFSMNSLQTSVSTNGGQLGKGSKDGQAQGSWVDGNSASDAVGTVGVWWGWWRGCTANYVAASRDDSMSNLLNPGCTQLRSTNRTMVVVPQPLHKDCCGPLLMLLLSVLEASMRCCQIVDAHTSQLSIISDATTLER